MAITRATVTILSDTLVLNIVDSTGQIIDTSNYELQSIASRYTVRPNGDRQFSLLYNEVPIVSVSNSVNLVGFKNTLFGSTDPMTAKVIYDSLVRFGSLPAPDTDSVINTRILTSSIDSVATVLSDGSNTPAVKLPSTAAVPTDKALVVAISPNNAMATAAKQDSLEAKLTNLGVGAAYTSTAAANTNTAVTLPATTGKAWIIYSVEYSYAGTPDPDKTLVVTEGSTVKRTTQVTGSGAQLLTINQIYTVGAAVTLTLLAGGVNIVGSLNVTARLAD